MTLHPATLAAIMGMALATYACRAGGYWVFRQVRPGPFARGVLHYLPGALFAAYVAPLLAAGGPPQWAGGAATVAGMVFTRNLALAIAAGTAACWVVWAAG